MTDSRSEADEAIVRLTSDEAVILFELLSRWFSPKEGPTPPAECFESTAECAALSTVLGALESQLAAPFDTHYGAILDDARERLASRWDYPTLSG